MMDALKLTSRIGRMGCGIYEAGEDCYVRLFVTDTGRVIPTNHRVISEDDLMQAYEWGLQDGSGREYPLLPADHEMNQLAAEPQEE